MNWHPVTFLLVAWSRVQECLHISSISFGLRSYANVLLTAHLSEVQVQAEFCLLLTGSLVLPGQGSLVFLYFWPSRTFHFVLEPPRPDCPRCFPPPYTRCLDIRPSLPYDQTGSLSLLHHLHGGSKCKGHNSCRSQKTSSRTCSLFVVCISRHMRPSFRFSKETCPQHFPRSEGFL